MPPFEVLSAGMEIMMIWKVSFQEDMEEIVCMGYLNWRNEISVINFFIYLHTYC